MIFKHLLKNKKATSLKGQVKRLLIFTQCHCNCAGGGAMVTLFIYLCAWVVRICVSGWMESSLACHVSGCRWRLCSAWNNAVKGQWKIHFFDAVGERKGSPPAHSGPNAHCWFRKERGSVGVCHQLQAAEQHYVSRSFASVLSRVRSPRLHMCLP